MQICFKYQCCIIIYINMKEYNFAFVFRQIEVAHDEQDLIQPFKHFKIQLYSNKHLISSTDQKKYAINDNNKIDLSQEIIRFTFTKTPKNHDQNGQIRFIQIVGQDESKIIGIYEFMLNNYIIAYEEYNRNIVELSVQISPHYSLVYDVFVEKTTEALKKIIQEHEFTKRLSFEKDCCLENNFLPQEMHNENMENNYKEIKYDMNSPAIMKKRYWSPTRRKKSLINLKAMSRTFHFEQKQVKTNDTSGSQNRITFYRMSRIASTVSDLDTPQLQKLTSHHSNFMNNIDPEIQQSPEHLLQLENKQKLIFNVIQQNSKISIGSLSNSSVSEKQVQKSLENANQISIKFKTKDRSSYLNLVKIIVMISFLIFLLATLLNSMGIPTLKINRKRNRKDDYIHNN